ncbi:Kinesin-like protein kin-5b [Thalictrum thalictroides]|uniref:Kinesin-like protein kin-5b n=1 Tax=Thalictrum thalictroides TaxID=46969 RepID=A0A7J6V881_THATH|nr:Kinesin-like protein kin-5b [Thalictrum thalictroides]
MMHFTPDPTRKAGLGVTPSPSPFFTPRPERRRMDSRVFDTNNLNRHQDRDRGGEVNVQVLLRCRPLNDDEQRLNIPKVISCNEQRREITVLQSIANKQVDRAFTFDKVFGPKAQQRSIYDHAISPIVNEVLEGFNCTVFAYGQTGTGKTYTMEGGMKTKGGELSAEAGVIPRAVRQIFDTLEAQKSDYSMKVTFLELYNEEITDLLAPEDCTRSVDDKQKKPISLMEDGKGGVIVRGLEEEVVYSAIEIYSLLERGSSKRRTVDTLLNKHSSRSHAVFSITIHVKDATIGDEELIKCGKLNLVDLAGSENILRSGSREGRAREAGEINKSLLTLGRVINALVEHSAHIPYRDSKLTRLLRDSLGGKTKTCIIATISPSLHCLEETLSTLDYACRAKNIKNKPEANQKMSKATLLKDLYLEMERMKQDVRAAREKNGVYIPHERFIQDEADKKAMNEKIEQLEIELELTVKKADKFQELYLAEQEQKFDLECILKDCKKNFESCNKALQDLQEKHRITISTLKEKEFIISNLLISENLIVERAKELRGNLLNASEHISVMSTEIDQKNKMESENHELVMTFGSQLDQSLKNLHRTVLGSVSQQQQQLRCMEEHIGSFLASKCDASNVLQSRIEKVKDTYNSGVHAMKELAEMLQKESSSNLKQIESTILAQTLAVENFLVTAVKESEEVIQDIHGSLNEQNHLLAFSAQQQEEGLKRSLLSAQLISKETIEFFNNLHHSVSKLMNMLEEDQMEKSQRLASFGKTFQEESLIEEKLALDKIAVILGTLTSKKTDMVSKAMRNMDEENIEVQGRLEQKMFDVQKASSNAKRGWSEYFGNVQRQFVEDTFSASESRVTMENIIQGCSERVDDSRKQWEHAEMRVDLLNKEGIAKIRSIVEEKIHDNQNTLKEIRYLSSTTGAESDAGVCNLLEVVSNSLQLDHETKKEIELMSTLCLGQLKSIQEKHSENISTIRSRADQCLTKEYLVDNITSTTRENRGIIVPTLESIEALKTPSLENLVAKLRPLNSSKINNPGSKIQHLEQPCSVSPNRSPFAAVN